MNHHFSLDNFRRVFPSDQETLGQRLIQSPEQSCEFTFANLLNWGAVLDSQWLDDPDFIYIWIKKNDLFMIAEAPGVITSDLCRYVSEVLRSHHYSGVLSHVREETLQCCPELLKYFTPIQMTDFHGEYLYLTENIACLKGKKYSAKRNLIAQFKQACPDYSVEPLSAENLKDVYELSQKWYFEHDVSKSRLMMNDFEAFQNAFQNYPNNGLEGLVIKTQNQVIAFSMFAQTNADTWDIVFEKADRSFKGASVLMFSETARTLLGKARWINMEQDLDSPGLRQMKRSFAPTQFLRNYQLFPKDSF